MFMPIRMPKKTSMVLDGYASIVSRQYDVLVTFLEKTVDSIRVQFSHTFRRPET